MKIVKVIIVLFIVFTSLLYGKPTLSVEEDLVQFQLKDEIRTSKKIIKIGEGRFENYTYKFFKEKSTYRLRINGEGPLSFIIIFKNSELLFPDELPPLTSPFIIFKSKDKTFMFYVEKDDKNLWKIEKDENNIYIKYNLYIKRKRNISFSIKEVRGLIDGIKEYRNFSKDEGGRIKTGGTLYPDASLTKVRNAGIYDFDLSFRIINPLNENVITRIFESENVGMDSFLLFNPFEYTIIEKGEVSPKDLYFSKDYIKKNFSIAILTSGIRDKEGNFYKLKRKAEPTLKIERTVKGKSVIVKEIPDMREDFMENVFVMNPDPDFLKNMLISAYDINYFHKIFFTDVSINAENRKRNLTKDERGDYAGYAIDLTDISGVYDYELSNIKGEPLVFMEGKPCTYFPFEVLSFINKEKDNNLILTINPPIFQIGFNSDIVVKEIKDISYLKNLPVERAIYNKRILIFSLSTLTDNINRNLVERFFRRCLLFGVYPTFTKSRDDPYSLWNKQELVNMVKPYFLEYIPLIRKVTEREWKPETFARVSDGDVERFGDFPDIILTIDGSGYLEIDKKSLNIKDGYEVVDLGTKKPLKASEENGKIYVKLDNTKVVHIFKGESEKAVSWNFIKERGKPPFFILLLLPLFFIPLLKKEIILTRPSLKITLILTTLLLFLLRRVLFYIPSPPFTFLLLSIIHFLSTFYFKNVKRSIFAVVSIFFFSSFSIFTIINKGFKVSPFPPFEFPYDLYFFIIFLSLFLVITTMYKTKRRTSFFIIALFVIFFFLSSIITFPFFSPPMDTVFLIISIVMGLILLALSKGIFSFLSTLIYFSLLAIYVFWDKIYFYLLQHKIFLGRDILPALMISLFSILYIVFTEKRQFVKSPESLYVIFLIVISIISLSFHYLFMYNPSAIGIFLGIVKIIIYAFLILFSIYVFEVLIFRREE